MATVYLVLPHYNHNNFSKVITVKKCYNASNLITPAKPYTATNTDEMKTLLTTINTALIDRIFGGIVVETRKSQACF